MAIELLRQSVSELIAAGEVVDRPASVVKELIENAIDAGAGQIEIELRRSGLESIRVTDNGCGIDPKEIRTAFLRHATSKIRMEEDLDHIATLGFRGEALAAIASVARVRLISRRIKDAFASECRMRGGKEEYFGEAAGGAGTTLLVEDLFFNTPARMKFMKKDAAEGTAAEAVVEQAALSHPEIAFRLIREGKPVLSTPGNGDLFAAAYAVFPKDVARQLIAVNGSEGFAAVTGYTGRPEASRKSRGFQYVYVNRRFVRSPTVIAAAEQAYRNLKMTGRFPVFVLHLSVPYDRVDVNVHPAKTEVRFDDDRAVFRAVRQAVFDAAGGFASDFSEQLADGEPIRRSARAAGVGEPFPEPPDPVIKETPSAGGNAGAEKSFLLFDAAGADVSGQAKEDGVTFRAPAAAVYSRGVSPPPPAAEIARKACPKEYPAACGGEVYSAEPARTPVRQSRAKIDIDPLPDDGAEKERMDVRLIGELFGTYILCSAGDVFLLIDKHAAHERILFERFRIQNLHASRQLLIQPEIVSVTPDEKEALLRSREILGQVGFLVEDFGLREIAVREVPTYFSAGRVSGAIQQIAGQLMEHSEQPETEETAWLLHSVACRAAIKAGHRTSESEMIAIARDILCSAVPKYCPHGRPVYISMTRGEIERRFGRIQ